MFRVTAIGLTLQRKKLDPIEEFILRSIRIGITNAVEIAGLLGLPQNVVDVVIASLVGAANVVVCNGGDTLALTDRGLWMIEEEADIRPAEQTLPFIYDAILRLPRWYGDAPLIAPRELRDFEIAPLRAYPDRGPELHEVNPREVGEVVALAAGRGHEGFTILKLLSIEKRVRLFKEAVALLYQADDSKERQIAFVIDGRLSEPHERAFANSNGASRNDIFSVDADDRELTQVRDSLGPSIRQQLESPAAHTVRAHLATTRARQLAQRNATVAPTIAASVSRTVQQGSSGEREVSGPMPHGSSPIVRHLEVYEHPSALHDALENAKSRLLLISPWIRAQVVDKGFLSAIERLCRNDVVVTIGYGIGSSDADERPRDRVAREALHAIAVRWQSCTVERLGDTHAKILIKDQEHYIVGSFNWLSFRGDRDKPFREEIGVLVQDPAEVDALYERCIRRFSSIT